MALYCAWNTDNGGPMRAGGEQSTYAALRKKFPKASVHTSTFDAFYAAARGGLGSVAVLPAAGTEP